MITISLPYNTNIEDSKFIKDLSRQYSIIVRFSYNRFKEGKTQKDIRSMTSSLKNIDLLNSWIIQCAIKEGESIYLKNLDRKVIFGSKRHFYRRVKGLISNDELKIKRILPLMIQGESTKMGNRSFKLDIINNNEIVFKVSRDKHIKLKLPKLRNNYKNYFTTLNNLMILNKDNKD